MTGARPGDAQSLADGLAVLLRDSDLSMSMRERIGRLCESYYWDALVAHGPLSMPVRSCRWP